MAFKELTKQRVRQLYQFLREANQLRFRPVRRLSEQPKVVSLSELPNHPAVQLFRPICTSNGEEVSDLLLRVKRPSLTRCPQPPEIIDPWLFPGWDDPLKEAVFIESQNTIDEDGKTITIRFDDDDERAAAYIEWDTLRHAWLVPEIPARRALHSFEIFYEIHAMLEKEGEELELLVADGHLAWQTISGIDGAVTINHPVLLKRVELRFDPTEPEFTIHETDREPELYGALFVDLQEVAPAALRNRQNELAVSGYHPLGWEDTDAFLKAFVQTVSPVNGQFVDEPESGAADIPRLWRSPVLLIRKRVAGIANAIDTIIDDIDRQEVFPPALAQITGTTGSWDTQGMGPGDGSESSALSQRFAPTPETISDDDILLAKEANEEQLQIIRKLSRSGSVIVQGPPGTGKTHTIGNLIGHLLAQGKSILVTSQTTKALRVLKSHVPKILQPLCVSVLGSDQDARRQLESSISSITEHLTRDTSSTLLAKARNLMHERKELLKKTRELANLLRQALENEYREIEIEDKSFSPSDAARYVAHNRGQHDWIPCPIKLGADLSLTEQQLVQLYALGALFSSEEERDARYPLPELSDLPSERQFRSMVSEYQALMVRDLSLGEDRWDGTRNSINTIEDLVSILATEFSDDLRRLTWRPYAIVAGIHSGTEREVWEKLMSSIEEACEVNARHALFMNHRPKLSNTLPVVRQRRVTLEICDYLDSGGKLSFVQLVTRTEWRQFIKTVSVTAGRPHHRDHFQALAHLAHLELLRLELEDLWDALIGQRANTPFNTLGPTPELSCRGLVQEIRRCLDWHSSVWLPLVNNMKAEGLKLDGLTAQLPREASQITEYMLIEQMACAVLPPILEAEASRRKLKECALGFDRLTELSAQIDPSAPDRGCTGKIIAAVRSCNVDEYAKALEYARRLHTVKPLAKKREDLLSRLEFVAPGWAEHISMRLPPHNSEQLPGEVMPAWIWRQLNDTLVEQDRLDTQDLQRQIDKTREFLRQMTQWLIDAQAWGKQIERLQEDNSVRQALVGWLDTTARLVSTRQIDRRQQLLSEARKLMRQCAGAVPVWIMPISLVAESFDPRITRFDVVIIDEASQADLNALIPLYMGKQILVVGDHEQVTPLGVGKDQTILENLRKSILQDIPNAHLFDNMSSIYGIARQSFGDAIRLVEHFRCVPEIIAFSNQLSYEGTIKPLRESNSTRLKPACIPYRVDGLREGEINRKEAETIVSMIKAMIKHPTYLGKTMGIISMVKESQAVLIETMLHREIDGVEIENRRIQAGISGQFQGDERDIIFLSMVDSPEEEGLLRAVGEGAFEQTKKRYNVAASRARDQLWVIHSFDPDHHLKPNDIRLRLLQHVKDPWATVRAYNVEAGKVQSDFERQVLRRLTDSGYRVKSQWEVGYYRIDLVVEGGGRRLAIECDGDRYHPLEKLADDMARQTILERLGWHFVRMRGSAFYRNPEGAMKSVFDRLAEMEIPPEGQPEEDPSTDWTLLHELEKLVKENEEVNETEKSVETDKTEEGISFEDSSLFPSEQRDSDKPVSTRNNRTTQVLNIGDRLPGKPVNPRLEGVLEWSKKRAQRDGQFTSEVLQGSIVYVLQECPNKSCTKHSLTARISRHLGFHTIGQKKIDFDKLVLRALDRLKSKGVVEEYTATVVRIRLVAGIAHQPSMFKDTTYA